SVEYIIRDSGSRVIFIENEELYRRIAGILPQCAAIEKIIFFQPPSEMPPGSISLAELEAGGSDTAKENSDDIDKLDIRQTDIATLIYTSGTTGEPKGVMLTHCNIISNVIDAGEKYDFAKGDCPLSVLPLSHIFER
ncbi:AMP-binding protein, partial [Vibrio parahaemolyticus]|uniref:AMP-binding protein n=1 Tax=Vibrio parahaemolyticus TaxID=670 RepID=UPI00146B29AB